ncbi:ATM interactor [Brachionichthys hirsutus]|uniref:ATM interactor n=1 Tax=Brachionichthys hirsutus TaxID=412623 RepID=UPI00360496E3
MVNPTVRKDMKGSQKLYCCPIEGCPRGPTRPFSQFALVKQHFMKMHAEKKHKCFKCSNGYSTEWDLKRHIEDCGRIYHCTCGCPYASRAALLSHVYRTGHEIPTEHRIPPVKKRKMEKMLSDSEKVKTVEPPRQIASVGKELMETPLPSDTAVHVQDSVRRNSSPRKSVQKLLLPKPKMALVSVPVMQLAHLPVLLPSTGSGALRSVVLAVDSQGSVGALRLLPQAAGAFVPHLDAKILGFSDSTSHANPGPVSTGVQASPDDVAGGLAGQPGRRTSATIQTDKSYLSKAPEFEEGGGLCTVGESSVSSCAQTDISVSAQVLLPVSVETQTFSSRVRATSSIGAQTDAHCLTPVPCCSSSSSSSSSSPLPPYRTRQTQTYFAIPLSEEKAQDPAIVCSDLFDSVSTQTALGIDDSLAAGSSVYEDAKAAGAMCFGAQADELSSNAMADNQTQTMTLLSDLENILSDSMSGHQVLAEASAGCGSGLGSVQDFDFEEFLNAVHIQTQTEDSELAGPGGETPLESLDIQTQTDFLLMDEADQSRTPASDLELLDIQTQTDLNFLLNAGSHIPLSGMLRHSSFSMSTESSDTETQTDLSASAPAPAGQGEHARLLNTTETQTMASQAEGLGHLFLTSNETQTVMDDFLSADLAWNVESHFSSVETQTCEELRALFQQPEKPNS